MRRVRTDDAASRHRLVVIHVFYFSTFFQTQPRIDNILISSNSQTSREAT